MKIADVLLPQNISYECYMKIGEKCRWRFDFRDCIKICHVNNPNIVEILFFYQCVSVCGKIYNWKINLLNLFPDSDRDSIFNHRSIVEKKNHVF